MSYQEPGQLKWWQKAIFYQVYPRSFADSNGDGIGDLPGLTTRLEYLHTLGIDAIWLSPHYPSPQVDCGYDIADYMSVAPEYGTLDHFKIFPKDRSSIRPACGHRSSTQPHIGPTSLVH